MGVLPYIQVVDELLFLTESHQQKRTKEVNFSKNQQVLDQQTIEIKQLKQIAALKNN